MEGYPSCHPHLAAYVMCDVGFADAVRSGGADVVADGPEDTRSSHKLAVEGR